MGWERKKSSVVVRVDSGYHLGKICNIVERDSWYHLGTPITQNVCVCVIEAVTRPLYFFRTSRSQNG